MMIVRRLTDRSSIRPFLEREREWALYALADLDEGLFEQCDWWGCGDGLALVFHGLDIRPIFLMGSASEVRALLSALPTASGYLNLQPHMLSCAEGLYVFRHRHEMRRMMLGHFVPRPGNTRTLTPADLADIESLYASGDNAATAFAPVQLKTGLFRGIREDGVLVAVAGVQAISLAEGVAAVGNVFVREDRRGRGLARAVLSDTVAAVLDAGVRTIGLNVEHSNASAVRAYEALGFRTVLQYVEGMADRVGAMAPPTGNRT
jgi:ribosomal protein S18 acetylase RimI-like enzyme